MKNQFVRMTPDANNMVTEMCEDKPFAIDILCVECSWTGHFEDGSTDHFFNHQCRLVSQMASTRD